jgi:DNA-binding CsgD family transcriptional regulator
MVSNGDKHRGRRNSGAVRCSASKLFEVTEQIYTAAGDLEAWPAALAAAADALGARTMSLTIVDPAGKSMPLVVAPRTDSEWIRTYVDRWAASNIVREHGYAVPPGEVYDFETLGMPRSEFERTQFFNEFLAPQHIHFGLISMVAREELVTGTLGFYRSEADGRFGRGEERALQTLVPHVGRAVRLTLRLAQIEMQRNSMADILNRHSDGVLLVDAQAGILFANDKAQALMSEGALRSSNGRLSAGVAAKTAALRSLIAGEVTQLPTGVLALSGRDAAQLATEVVPLKAEIGWLPKQPAAIVFIRDSKPHSLPSRQQIQRLFGFTPAQASLARELLNGDGIPAAAARLGISRSTARTHLAELFQRTGTNRQAELVRVILQQKLAGDETGANGSLITAAGDRRASWRAVVSVTFMHAVGVASLLAAVAGA